MNLRMVVRVLQEAPENSIAADIAAAEEIRWRARPYRLKRKRIVLDGVCATEGDRLDGDSAVPAAVVREWAPVFQERDVDPGAMRYFAPFIEAGYGHTCWTWPRGAIRDAAARSAHSSLGPDAISDAFWSCAPQDVGLLEFAAGQMSLGVPPPPQLLHSLTVFIPKGGYDSNLERINRRLGEQQR